MLAKYFSPRAQTLRQPLGNYLSKAVWNVAQAHFGAGLPSEEVEERGKPMPSRSHLEGLWELSSAVGNFLFWFVLAW